MARIHVLETTEAGTRVVVHTPVPGGNNSVGVSWQAAGLADGSLGTTEMAVGSGPGRILQAEADQLVVGSVAEFNLQVGGTTVAQLNAAVTVALAAWTKGTQERLQFYGYTQA